MLTAHAPAGYVVSKLAIGLGLIPERVLPPRAIVGIGVVAAILPDFDMIHFYTIDARQHLHHSYWTHIPLFWVVVCATATLICYVIRRHEFMPIVLLAGINFLFHCFLDTIVAGILWHKPFVHRYTVFAEVPNVYPHTFLNFVLHWTFGLEILIWAVAVGLFAFGKRGGIWHWLAGVMEGGCRSLGAFKPSR